VTILEVMGRNAGWVAAASALARRSPEDPPHAIYVPERPLTANQVVRDTELAVRRHGYALLVVTETVRDEHGKPWARRTGDDGFGHARLAGAAERIGALIEEKLKLRARFNKPGTLQRASGGCVSNVDWDEAYLVGKTAVRSAVDGARDVMVTLLRRPGPAYSCSTGLAPLTSIANAERRLPPDFLDGEGHITPAFMDYARPLIGGDLPLYATLAGVGPEGRG
jgi:6-phosphofructokinase 1